MLEFQIILPLFTCLPFRFNNIQWIWKIILTVPHFLFVWSTQPRCFFQTWFKYSITSSILSPNFKEEDSGSRSIVSPAGTWYSISLFVNNDDEKNNNNNTNNTGYISSWFVKIKTTHIKLNSTRKQENKGTKIKQHANNELNATNDRKHCREENVLLGE